MCCIVARILIADDSNVIRTRVASWIAHEHDLELVGQAENGARCVDLFQRLKPDVIILDVEMPELDGIETLRQIRAIDATVPVIMFSALTELGSRTTVASMLAGATDHVAKPASFRVEDETRRLLIARVRSLVRQRVFVPLTGSTSVVEHNETQVPEAPEIIVVAASTGGPSALREFLTAVGRIEVPILVVQHIPAHFLGMLVEQLAAMLATDVAIGIDGETLTAGSVRFAPSGTHIEVRSREGRMLLGYLDLPPVNSCKPSADILFASAAMTARRPIAVILSGMGSDGLVGAGTIVANGGGVYAQDRRSSAVWGMPGSVVEQGLARLVGPPGRIGARVRLLSQRAVKV
jgi:two-component system chemotaxis response regulator CheB